MKTKHTPGPWTRENIALKHGDCVQGIIAGTEPNAKFVARVHHDGSDRSIANVRLMAAAPDLLEACRALLPHAEYRHEHGDDHDSITGEIDGTYALLVAAIAKAEGEPASL